MYLYVHLSLLCGDGAQLIIRIFCLKMHKWMQWAASNCYTHLLKLCAGIDMYVCICTHLYCALQKIDLPHFRVFFFYFFLQYFIHSLFVQHVHQTPCILIVIALSFCVTIWLTALPVLCAFFLWRCVLFFPSNNFTVLVSLQPSFLFFLIFFLLFGNLCPFMLPNNLHFHFEFRPTFFLPFSKQLL